MSFESYVSPDVRLLRFHQNIKGSETLSFLRKTYHKYFAGFLIGLVALIAWPASQLTGRVGGLGITTPSAHLISYIITGDSKQLGWGVFLVLGDFFLVPFLLQRVLESFVGACQTCQPSVRAH